MPCIHILQVLKSLELMAQEQQSLAGAPESQLVELLDSMTVGASTCRFQQPLCSAHAGLPPSLTNPTLGMQPHSVNLHENTTGACLFYCHLQARITDGNAKVSIQALETLGALFLCLRGRCR
jgi:hypothetical protein